MLRHHVDIIDEFPGSDLVGRAYEPLFDAVPRGDSTTAWTVLAADWVTTTDGTGVVHTAVMYGEDDYNLGMEAGLPAHHTVGMDGAFVEGTHPELDGLLCVKDCDTTIIGLLSAPGGATARDRKAACSTGRRITSTTTRTAGAPTIRSSTTWIPGLFA